MNLVAVVEKRGQKQIQRLSVAANDPVILGRGWNSQIVIDDDYVDPAHAQLYLNEQSQLCIRDLGSQNGTRVNRKKLASAQVLHGCSKVKLGDTSVEIFNAETDVKPALKRSSGQRLIRRFSSAGGILLSTVAASLAMLLSIYLMSFEEANSENIVMSYVGLGVMIFGWSLLAGVVGKLFRGETNITSHWVCVCLFFSCAMVLNFLLDILKFNLDSDRVNEVIEWITITGFVVMFSYVTLCLSTGLTTKKKVVFSSLLAALPLLYSQISPLLVEEHDNWSDWASVSQPNRSPVFMLRTPTSIDTHFERTADLFTVLEDEVNSGSDSESPESAGTPLQMSESN
ncbi:hypothetical protein AB833_28405 [Chromatiales bacterium (ex Bugula neritina AB1)]|nr:hypothetical protein AB833_28405 [Chromatiales bacterium (ex Bugula neritina AB1)]